jgi:hypothetical protein
MRVWLGVGLFDEAAAAVGPQREQMMRAGLARQWCYPILRFGCAHDHGGLGIAQEVGQLGCLVSRIERQVDVA